VGSRLSLNVSGAGAVTTMALEGELDLAAGDGLLSRLETELERAPVEVVFDLGALKFIDSTGLRTLLQARDICDRSGSRLSIAECQGHVARVLALTGLDSVLSVVHEASAPAEVSS
jgi:anti-sigma B factor antagonist